MLPFQDIIEAQSGSIKPGQNVLIVDDLLATGGESVLMFSDMNIRLLYLYEDINYVCQFIFSILGYTYMRKKLL